MKDWFEEYPELLEYEIGELKKNGIQVKDFKIDFEVFSRDGVVLNCIIPIKNNLGINLEEDLGLRVIFPSNYPYFRPEVYVTTDITLPRHQNPVGKNLCLIPRPSQFWNVNDCLYKYLKERLPIVLTKGLIDDQDVIGMDPEEQAEPVSEYFIDKTNAVILSARPEIENKELSNTSEPFTILDHGDLKVSYNSNNSKVTLFDTFKMDDKLFPIPKYDDKSEIMKIILKEWVDSEGKIIGKNPFNNLNQFRFDHKTKWYKINSLTKLLDNANPYKWFIDELVKNDIPRPKNIKINAKDYKVTGFVGLLFPEEEVAGKIGWGWIFFINGYIIQLKGRQLKEKIIRPLVLPIMSVDQSDLSKRIPCSESLKGKTVSVVGLGSLGAPSVLEFVKNGVSKIKLMDFDIVDFTTSIRWPLGLEYSGYLKTVALRDFIKKNYPSVQVEIFNHKIGSADFITFPNENKILETFLNDSSIVYDASAEEGVNNLISLLCKKKSIPYIEIESRRGAWGGLVMRVLPKSKKGCWMCLQYSLYFDKTIPLPKDDKNGTIQPKGCGDPTFTGSSFDLQNISLAGVRMAISSLSDDNSNGDWDVAVLSMVDDNDKPIAPTWIKKTIEINPECKICNDKSLD